MYIQGWIDILVGSKDKLETEVDNEVEVTGFKTIMVTEEGPMVTEGDIIIEREIKIE